MNHDALDAVIAAAGHKTAQGGAGLTFLGWALSSEGTAAIGICIGVLGLTIQWYYRRKQDRREQEEHDLRMSKLSDGG